MQPPYPLDPDTDPWTAVGGGLFAAQASTVPPEFGECWFVVERPGHAVRAEIAKARWHIREAERHADNAAMGAQVSLWLSYFSVALAVFALVAANRRRRP